MKRSFVYVLLLMLMVSAQVSSAEEEKRLLFPGNGYSIAPLEGVPGKDMYQTLFMFLPSSAGFAPNVNVQIQPYEGSVDEYLELSLQQFRDNAVEVLAQGKAGENAVFFEYHGPFQGSDMHWYARAIKRGSFVYLVTATALETQWDETKDALKTCVDSFRLE